MPGPPPPPAIHSIKVHNLWDNSAHSVQPRTPRMVAHQWNKMVSIHASDIQCHRSIAFDVAMPHKAQVNAHNAKPIRIERPADLRRSAQTLNNMSPMMLKL